VVIGAGGVGLNSIQGAAIAGARRIVAVDVNQTKLETARRFGATDVLDGRDDDAVARVRCLTDGRGADYVFVTVGAAAAVRQAFELASPSGAIVLVGMPPSGVTVELDPGTLAAQNQRILGSKMGGARIETDIPYLVALYQAGRLKLDELISSRFPLAAINEAIAEVKQGEVLRNVIVM
jgi:Zn-dependent alcohol dehydrogenase